MPDLKPFNPDKTVTPKELEEQQKKLIKLWESEDLSKKEIQDNIRYFRQMVGLPIETEEEKQRRITLEEVRKWVNSVQGQFNIQDLYNWMPELVRTPPEKRRISGHLARLVKEGLIERNGRYGVFTKIDDELELMDFIHADEKALDIWLPFNLTDYVEIMPGNIILIAGEKETGKTTLAMNIAWANRNRFQVHYFNSEMGPGELKKRVGKFKNTDPYEWAEKISFYPKADNFQHVIKTKANDINIIDFMEVAGDQYPFVAAWIQEIHKKIIRDGAIVFICLQKPPGRDEGTGGYGTLDKPRLYLAVSRGRMKIVTAKNWAGEKNPRDLTIDFKIVQGSELIPTSDWDKSDKWSL